MYYINKIVWFFINPASVALMLMLASLLMRSRFPRTARAVGIAAFCWMWFFCSPLCMAALGVPLEAPYRANMSAESLPQADAIVVLGGGMYASLSHPYPDMNDSADRVWHAARLWKAGKAPLVIASGSGEKNGAVPLLLDLGVPASTIFVDDDSRNTYENTRLTARLLKERGLAHPRILVVTSAWHMTRALGNFSQIDAEVIPAATDFRVTLALEKMHLLNYIVPDASTFDTNARLFKEWIGRLARK